MTDIMDDAATSILSRDVEELCAFFRRHYRNRIGEPYELLQARGEASSAKWGPVWTFEARNHHAAERAGWMMRRLVDPSVVPVRHACRVVLRRHINTVETNATDMVEVIVVTILPQRAQVVLLLASCTRIAGLPFLRCGGAEIVAVAMGVRPKDDGCA